MKRSTALVLTALAVPAALLPATAATAASGSDDKGTQVYRSMLMELNDSGATGTAQLRLKGDQLEIRVKARGLAPNLVHAQHIHGEGNMECPTPSADKNGDGFVGVLEGVPFYGPIVTSLTTSGDTSPAAGLELSIMPVADERGRIDYRRTITLPADVSTDLEDYQIVQHGVDVNRNGEYDFAGAGRSDLLGGAVPFEATAPANCGTIDHVSQSHSH